MLFIDLNRLQLSSTFKALTHAIEEKDLQKNIPQEISSGAIKALLDLAAFCVDRTNCVETLYQAVFYRATGKAEKYSELAKKQILKKVMMSSSERDAKYNVMSLLCTKSGQQNLFWASYFLERQNRSIYRFYKWLERLAMVEFEVVGTEPFTVDLTGIINEMTDHINTHVTVEPSFVEQYNRKLDDLHAQKGLRLTKVDTSRGFSKKSNSV